MNDFLLAGSLLGVLCLSSTAIAEKAPLSDEAIQSEAQAIVVATIEKIRIEPEASTFERGFGNSDWAIYLTLQVESVEKGKVQDATLEVKCFRIKSRRSMQEYLTPSGHHPIPGIGTRVRAYLKKRADSWDVVLPNGITAHGDGQQSDGVLPDAMEVAQLRSLAYTFVIPLEGWLIVALIGLPVLAFIGWRRRRILLLKETARSRSLNSEKVIMKRLTMICALGSLAVASSGWAREIENWPYDRLIKDADLVVIARAVSSAECKDEWNERFFDRSRFQGLETTFEVASALKGKSPESLKLLHFRYAKAASVYDDGPSLVSFLTKPRPAEARKQSEEPGELRPLSASKSSRPEYLLFLRLRKDGRYEAVSGQMDPSLSSRSIDQIGWSTCSVTSSRHWVSTSEWINGLEA